MTDSPRALSEMHHATTVAIAGRGVLISGPSGSGKSALALQLMAFGAALIADDGTLLRLQDGHLWAAAPDSLPAAIEARGVGLLSVQLAPPAPLVLAIDMGRVEAARLPAPKHRFFLGHKVALLHKVERAHFPAAIFQYVRGEGVLEV